MRTVNQQTEFLPWIFSLVFFPKVGAAHGILPLLILQLCCHHGSWSLNYLYVLLSSNKATIWLWYHCELLLLQNLQPKIFLHSVILSILRLFHILTRESASCSIGKHVEIMEVSQIVYLIISSSPFIGPLFVELILFGY